jgi:hypothetical protein
MVKERSRSLGSIGNVNPANFLNNIFAYFYPVAPLKEYREIHISGL